VPCDPAIELSAVSKWLGDRAAVAELDLAVPRGSVCGLLGPNGSGKTTTLRLVLRILLPDRGTVAVLGRSSGRAADDRVGYLPEERGLYRKMRVREVLRFHASLKGRRDGAAEVDGWLERLGLGAWGGARVEALSKGMAQKVQFIAAVVHRPELLVLDEPFTGLDPVNQDLLVDAVLGLRREGATVVISTHDMPVAERVCDRVAMLHRGRKVLDGPLAALREQDGPGTVRVAVEGPGPDLAGLPGVASVRGPGPVHELALLPGADPQAVLAELVRRARVTRFEVACPSLHDLFVRHAGEA
jgi:ABC-2 type transport system ATP-binding protein